MSQRSQCLVDDDAVLVDRLVYEPRTAPMQQRNQLGITGFLDRDRGTRLNQQLDRQEQGLLRAGRHQHLVWPCMDTAPRQHLGADLLHEHGIVGVACVDRPPLDLRHRQRQAARLTPLVHRKQRAVQAALDERIGIPLPVGRNRNQLLELPQCLQPPCPGRLSGGRSPARHPGLRTEAASPLPEADEDAATRSCLEVSVGDQLLVGGGHGIAGDAEMAGQRAARRHARAGSERPERDAGHDLLPDLVLQRERTFASDLQHGRAEQPGDTAARTRPRHPAASRPHHSATNSATTFVTRRSDSRSTRSSKPWMFSAVGPYTSAGMPA